MPDIFDEIDAKPRDVFDEVASQPPEHGPVMQALVKGGNFLSDAIGASAIDLIPGGKEFMEKPLPWLHEANQASAIPSALRLLEKRGGTTGEIAGGLGEGLEGLSNFFETPKGIGTTAGAILAPPTASKAIAGVFGAQMAASEPEAVSRLIDAIKAKDPRAITAALVQNAANVALPYQLFKHAFSPETVAPETKKALDETAPPPTPPTSPQQPVQTTQAQPDLTPLNPAGTAPDLSTVDLVDEWRVKGMGAVEVIERSADGKKALVRPVDPTVFEMTPVEIPIRKLYKTKVLKPKETNAIQEPSATEAVRGMPEQPGINEGQVPAQESAGGVPRGTVSPGEEAGRRGAGEEAGSEIPLTQEAQALLQSKGVPAFVTKNLERIARGNGVNPVGKTPNQIIDELRQRIPKAGSQVSLTPEELAAEQAYQAQERSAIDQGVQGNKDAGLPSNVVDWAPGQNEPFAGTIAKVDDQGNIQLNKPEFRKWLSSVPEENRKTAVKSLFAEEGIHSVAAKVSSNEELAALWNGLTGPERALVNKSYTGKLRGLPGRFTDAQLGHEYLRRVMQRLMRMPVREVAESGKLSEKVIDIIERVITAVRKLAGKNVAVDALTNRIQEHISGEQVGTKGGQLNQPEAFRKPGKDEGQDTFRFLPPTGQNEAKPGEPVFATKTVTPAALDAMLAEHLSGGRPRFRDFSDQITKEFPGVQKGQVREAWEDAVWKRTMEASGDELRKLADRLGLRESVANEIPDRIQEDTGFKLEGQADTGAKQIAKEAQSSITSGQRTRQNAIARVAEKLIGESEDVSKALRRQEVTTGDIGWWRKSAIEPYHEITGAERADPKLLGRVITDAGAVDRTGKRALPESATKRVVALLNNQTGKVDLVSVYRKGTGTVLIADPERASLGRARPHVPLNELLAQKATGNRPRYKPLASVLLDEPVQSFQQRFASEKAFQDEFGRPAAEEQARRTAYSEGEHLPEGVPGDLVREEKPGAIETGANRPLTDAESGALLDHLYDEVGKLDSRNDLDDSLESLKVKAESGTLTGRDWQAINALQKLVLKVERENPQLKGTDEAVKVALDRFYEGASSASSREEFIRKLGVAKEPVRAVPVRPAEPGDYHQIAANRRFQQRITDAAAEQQRLNEALDKADKLNGVPTEPTPEAFRKEDIGDSILLFRRAVGAMFRRNPTEKDIVRWRDASDTVANSNGKQAGYSVRIASRMGKKPTQRDIAIRKMAVAAIQSGNVTAKLQEFVQLAQIGMAGARQDLANGGPIERIRARKRYKTAVALRDIALQALANQGNVDLQRTDRFARRELESQRRAELNAGIKGRKDPNYVPGRYEGEMFDDDGITFGQDVLGKNFRKAKIFDSYWHAIAAGNYIPKSLDIADLVEHRVRQGQRQINKGAWLERSKSMIDPTSGKPVGADLIQNPNDPNQLMPPNPFYVEFDLGHGRGRIAILKPYESLFKRMTMESGIAQSTAGRGALYYTGLAKHGVQLVFDTFHPGRLIEYGLATQGKDLGYNRGVTALDIREQDLNQAVRNGMISPQEAAWAKGTVDVGGQTYTRQELLMSAQKAGLNVGRVSDAIYKEFYDSYPFLGKFNRWVFDRITRGLMAETAVKGIVDTAKKYPNLSFDETVKRVSSDVNTYYANLGRQGWIQNPTIRDITQLLFLAPQWVEGLITKEAKFYSRLAKTGVDVARGRFDQPKLGVLGKGVGTGLAGYFLLTQAINLLTRHQLTMQNKEEDHKFDAWIPNFNPWSKDKSGFFLSPLSVFSEIVHDVVRYTKTKPTAWEALQQIGENKLSIGGRAALVGITHHTPTGQELTTTAQIAGGVAKQLIPSPISFGKYGQALGHAVLPNLIRGVPPGQLQRQVFGSAGIKIDPAQTAVQQLNQKARAFLDAHGIKRDPFQPTDDPSYYNIRKAIQAEDNEHAKEIISSLLKDHTPGQMLDAMGRNVSKSYTGSLAREAKFIQSLTPDQRKLLVEGQRQKLATVLQFNALLNQVLKEEADQRKREKLSK